MALFDIELSVTKDNMLFRRACIDDFDIIKNLWKENKREFGVPYTKSIMRFIEKTNSYLMFVDDVFVGMCGFTKNRQGEIYIVCIGITSNNKRKGYELTLLKFICNLIYKRFGLCDVYAIALDGAENNNFYDKIGKCINYIEYATCIGRQYKLDRRLLHE